MQDTKPLKLSQLSGDLAIYFTWSANALCPTNPQAIDLYFQANQAAIVKTAQKLLQGINFAPGLLYRGIVLREPIVTLKPHHKIKYLSFSESRLVAQHFADVDGFGSQYIDVRAQLGTFGYVIEYMPEVTEVVFHYHLLSVLPYAEAFSKLGMRGDVEVKTMTWQREVMIVQPTEPFIQISRHT